MSYAYTATFLNKIDFITFKPYFINFKKADLPNGVCLWPASTGHDRSRDEKGQKRDLGRSENLDCGRHDPASGTDLALL
jgi:hypothetical protein